jgi:uracil-DNA glycosylase family 4
MEDKFRIALSNLRKSRNISKLTTFTEALYSGVEWSFVSATDPVKPQASLQPSEKVEVIQDFQAYTSKKLTESPVAELAFPGGIIKPKHPTEIVFEQIESLPIETNGPVKIFFIADYFQEELVEDGQQLYQYFKSRNEADLFAKMLKAMKLSEQDYFISSCQKNREQTQTTHQLMGEVKAVKPALVITLGSQAINTLLSTKMRLSDIHGKFYDLKIKGKDGSEHLTLLMPLFHPEFLFMNPSMKGTAWSDMQEAMKRIGL